MKKSQKILALLFAAFFVLTGCAERPAASYADGSPQSSQTRESQVDAKASETPAATTAPLPENTVGPNTLRICVDLCSIYSDDERSMKIGMDRFFRLTEEKGGPTDVAVDYIPASGSEREIKLESLRTEIMAGEGPDLFILSGDIHSSDGLFPMFELTMRSGAFLPLDTYIENAQFMEWEKLTPQVMEAGRTGEGQVALPLTYSIPLTFYRKSEVSHTPSAEMTWADMLADETGVLQNAASTIHLDTIDPYGVGEKSVCNVGNTVVEALGELADYDARALRFSEEELLQFTKEAFALKEQVLEGAFDTLPVFRKEIMRPNYDFFWSAPAETDALRTDETVTMIPIYSKNGGVTASIGNWACINRNAKHAEEAFFILDLLLSLEVQQEAHWYKMYDMWERVALPMHMDLMQEAVPIDPMNAPLYISEENFDALDAVREQITSARFAGGLEVQLENMYLEWVNIQEGNFPEQSLEDVVADTYRTMEQMLSE